jgi:hypothetical protein
MAISVLAMHLSPENGLKPLKNDQNLAFPISKGKHPDFVLPNNVK